MVDGEELARAAKAALNFITDEEYVPVVENLPHVSEIAFVGNQNAALSENRLGDEGGDVSRGLVLDGLGEFLGTALGTFRIRTRAIGATVGVGSRREGDAGHVGTAVLLAPAAARDRQGRIGPAVKAVGQCNELVAARVVLGQA